MTVKILLATNDSFSLRDAALIDAHIKKTYYLNKQQNNENIN